MSSDPDAIDELIELRRALPEPARTTANLTSDGTGLELRVPDHESHWLEASRGDSGWDIVEVRQLGSLLPAQRVVVATTTDDDVVGVVDREYRRLLIERRNAACGTPTRAT